MNEKAVQVHAPQAPSSLTYMHHCPGFQNADKPDDWFTESGEKLHEALERIEGDIAEGKIPSDDHTAELSDYETGLVNWTRDRAAEVEPDPEFIIKEYREEKLQVANGLTWGHPDRFLVCGLDREKPPTWAELMDYKFGEHSVPEPKKNGQFIAYALAIFEKWPTIKEVRCTILIPKLQQVLRHTFKRSRMRAMFCYVISTIHTVRHVNKVWTKTKEPTVLLRPGLQCAYCERSRVCSKVKRAALKIGEAYDENFTLPATVHSSEITEAEQLLIAWELHKVLERWCASVKHHVTEKAKSGVEIANHKLATRAGRRTLADPLLTWHELKEHIPEELLPFDDFLDCCEVKLGKLEEVIKANSPKGKGAANVRYLGQVMASGALVSRSAPSTILQKTKAKS